MYSQRSAKPRPANGSIRLIGGQWKRTRLTVPDRPDLRPTPDRVRETLFNWLGQDLTGLVVLDLFAGTGALGLEAASRGAARVTLVERDATLARALLDVVQQLRAQQVEVCAADAFEWSRRAEESGRRYDVILLDPPFRLNRFADALACAARLLQPGGVVYLESDQPMDEAQLQSLGWSVYRRGQAGMVHFQCLHRDGGA